MYFCVVLCIVCFVSFSVLFMCMCVLNYCHRMATQLQLNIYHIITHGNITSIFNLLVLKPRLPESCVTVQAVSRQALTVEAHAIHVEFLLDTWRWNSFNPPSECFGFPLLIPFHQCSILIFHLPPALWNLSNWQRHSIGPNLPRLYIRWRNGVNRRTHVEPPDSTCVLVVVTYANH
jgi:hypothetical protein